MGDAHVRCKRKERWILFSRGQQTERRQVRSIQVSFLRLFTSVLQTEISGGNFPEVFEIYDGIVCRQWFWEHLTWVLQAKLVYDLCRAVYPTGIETSNSLHCFPSYWAAKGGFSLLALSLSLPLMYYFNSYTIFICIVCCLRCFKCIINISCSAGLNPEPRMC